MSRKRTRNEAAQTSAPVSIPQLAIQTRALEEINAANHVSYCESDAVFAIMLDRSGILLATFMSSIKKLILGRIQRYKAIFESGKLSSQTRTVPESDLQKLVELLDMLTNEEATPNDSWARTAKQAFFWLAFGIEFAVRTRLMRQPEPFPNVVDQTRSTSDLVASRAESRIDPIAGMLYLQNDFKRLHGALIRAEGPTRPDVMFFVRESIALYVGYLLPGLPALRNK